MALTKPTGAMLNAGSTSAPQALGTAAAGTSQSYSRADHVHAMPSAGDVGAIPTSQLASLATTAQVAAITPASIGAIPTSAQSGFATLTGGHLTTSQTPALGGDITLAAGAVSAQVVALQGSAIAATAPTSGQVLAWNGTQWAPATASTGGGGGANGLTYYLNQGTAADAPTTNIPATPHQLGRTGETGQTTVTTGTLTQNTWVLVAGFVSESAPVDPATTTIPAGLWDFNVWAYGDANVAAGTSIRARAYIYNGTTLTLLGTSGGQIINNSSAQYSLSMLVQQTTVSLTDRIYIAIEAYATGNNHTVTAQFGDGTPSHVHTSLPLVGGTGLWKNSSGVLQSPASLLVDADVDAAAGIALSKIAGAASTAQVAAITPASIGAMATSERATYATTASVAAITAASLGALSTAQAVTLAQGGTGATSQQGALNAISATSLTGTSGYHFRSDGANVSLQPMSLNDVSAGVLGIGYGGTGTNNAGDARANLGGVQPVTVRQTSNVLPTTAGSLTAASYTSGSAVITFATASVTPVVGMSLNSIVINGVIKSVDSPTQITMTVAAGTTGTSAITLYNSTLTTLVTASLLTVDGKTLAIGDTVLLSQTALAQSGPWVVSSIGAGVSLVRPSWFTGNITAPLLVTITSGTGNQGAILTVGLAAGATGTQIGVESLTVGLVASRGNTNAVLGGNTFVGKNTFQANATGSGAVPFAFQAGALMTIPQAHSVEWDGTNEYVTTGALFAGSISTTTLTVTGTPTGVIQVGMLISGAGVTACTTITGLVSGTGAAGTYTVSASQTVSSTTITGQIRCIKATFINGAAGGTGAVPIAGAVGRPGQMAFDATYLYICTATNTWKKTALSSV